MVLTPSSESAAAGHQPRTNPTRRVGMPMRPQGPEGDGYHQGWYPVCRADEVAPGQVAGVPFLSGRVIVFRDPDGAPAVLSAYCRHLGADLSVGGEVLEGGVRCPFHHWRYGADGRCAHIPVADRIPPEAALYAYPSAERYGLVWAYNGPDGDPAAEPSEFPYWHTYEDMCRADDLVCLVGRVDAWPAEPWMMLSNVFDFQHLRALHGLEADPDPDSLVIGDRRVDYEVTLTDPVRGRKQSHLTVFGTNVLMSMGRREGDLHLHGSAVVPVPDGGSRAYTFAALPRSEVPTPEAEAAAREELERSMAWSYRLLAEDAPIFRSMHYRVDVLLPADRMLGRFFRYVQDFPRGNPGGLFLV